ncbi:MAG: hypothetical protein HXY50_14320 [Ignavibacteriaceae bacterium]|nr:hypothetical protein [Ignavibacteriaceae bacterium]
MKQAVILWLSAIVITFISGFIQNRISPDYPISGVISIEGEEVSYLFKKFHRKLEDFEIILRTKKSDLNAFVKWKKKNENDIWYIDSMKYSNSGLAAKIPTQSPLTEVIFKIILTTKNKTFTLPKAGYVNLTFLGAAPKSITIHYYFTLFFGLLLAVRAGLEAFSHKPRFRLYSIFTLISFFSCALIFAPIQRAYEMGIVGRSVPPAEKIFELWLLLLVGYWILTLVLSSFTKYSKFCVSLAAVLTILNFVFHNVFQNH